MDVTNGVCTACGRAIDAGARLCPFCGADPATGAKPDTQAVLQEVFRPREMTATDSVLEYARHRQGIVITIGLAAVFLLLTGLHQYVTWRNAKEVTSTPPVPLTEVTDINADPADRTPAMPNLEFQFDGQPERMRTLIVENGAVAPPEVVAARQAAAQEEAAKKAAASGVGPDGQPLRPMIPMRPSAQPPAQQQPLATPFANQPVPTAPPRP